MARIGSCIRVLGALALISTSTTGLAKPTAKPRKVLVMVRDPEHANLMVPKELVVMVDTLKAAGFRPVVASEDGRAFVSDTATVKSDLKFAKVRASDYVAAVLPCMSAGEPGYISDLAVKITKEVAAAGKPIAAQRSALYILSRADLLKGRRYAYYGGAPFAEGTRSEDPVVQDGNIITSAVCPAVEQTTGVAGSTEALINRLVETLG